MAWKGGDTVPAMNKFVGWHIYDYYQWLLDLIDGHMPPYYDYSLLLHELHSMKFTYGLEMDQNRANDGIRLRWQYIDEMNIPDIFYKEGIPCSVLEMMIGLAVRCDTEVMSDGDSKSASKWFWIMIENLDLMQCKDDNFNTDYVHQQIRKWLNRDFKRNGQGSPFPLSSRVRDQRKVDIWSQMSGYISENYYGNKL